MAEIRRETTKPDQEESFGRAGRAGYLADGFAEHFRRVNRNVRFDVAQLRRIPAVEPRELVFEGNFTPPTSR